MSDRPLAKEWQPLPLPEGGGVYSLVDLMRRPQPEPDPIDQATLMDLVKRGVLVGVEVFGATCCEHDLDDPDAPCPSGGFGLCDTFGPRSVGSDCNRAEHWLMRPANEHMTDALVAALNDDHMSGPDTNSTKPT